MKKINDNTRNTGWITTLCDEHFEKYLNRHNDRK